MKVASILASAFFTVACAQCLGLLLLHLLRPRISRAEQYLYAFASGSALLSLLVFLANAAHLAWTATFVAMGVGSIGACLYRRAYLPFEAKLPRLRWMDKGLLAVATPAFALLYFLHALAPEASPDGSAYHLGLVQTYLDQHGFGRITTDMYANLPLGAEMLYMFAFSFGRHSSAALVHFCFLLALPAFIVVIGQRFQAPRAGVLAAVMIFLSPVFGVDGSTAYIDVALAFMAVTLFAALQTWDDTRDAALLPLIGLFAGFAYAIKPTAFTGVLYAFVFLIYKLVRRRESFIGPALIVAGCAALMILPWLIKNAITVGNPFSPFLNAWFPNPYIRISGEESYRFYLRNYEGLKSYWDIPLEVTIRGAVLNGFLGPLFLLAPLGLLSLRWKLGRQLVLAAAIFASTYFENIGTRFLMSAAPFAAFAIALPVAQARGMVPLLIAFQVFASWPENLTLYAHQYSWRIDRFYWAAAFRIQSESEYLNYKIDGYATAKLAEQHVPKDGVIFTPGGIAHAYCRRKVLVAYQSALGNRLGESITAAVNRTFQPNRWWTYSFPPRRLRKLRMVQATAAPNDIWSVSEFRIFGPTGELQRTRDWQLRANPNPWDVQLAFDNCPVTRWYSAQRAKRGMYVEVSLPSEVELSAVRADATLDQQEGTARLEAEVDGKWIVLAEKPTISEATPTRGLRREAILDLKRAGVTHMSVQKDEYFAADMATDPARWGVTLLGETPTARLYRLD